MSESIVKSSVCPECGAPVPPGASCQANFHELLALEWKIPGGPGGIAHFFAVATYGIQHPESMGYTQETVDKLRGAVRDVLDGRASIAEIRKRMRVYSGSAGRVTRRGGEAVPLRVVTKWPTVVTDIVAGGVERYRERVEAWARATVDTLDAGK